MGFFRKFAIALVACGGRRPIVTVFASDRAEQLQSPSVKIRLGRREGVTLQAQTREGFHPHANVDLG